jgi:hypothetical protein
LTSGSSCIPFLNLDRKEHFFLLLRNKKYAKNGTREFAQLDAAEINTFTVFTHHHDITEILLKVALNTINQT